MQKVSPAEAVVFVNGKLRVDYAAGCAYLNEEELHLTPIEYKLLCLLTRNIGKVLTHTFLTQSIWGSSWIMILLPFVCLWQHFVKKLRKNQTLHNISKHTLAWGIGC